MSLKTSCEPPDASVVSARRVGRLCGSAGGVERLPVPGQEFGDTSGRMIGDTGEHVGDIVLRVETVELCGLDQRVDRSGAAAAGIGAGKQVILAANGDTAESAFGRIVVERYAAVVEAAHQRGPARPHI